MNRFGTIASTLRIAMLSIHSSPIGPLGTSRTGGMSVYVRELSRRLGEAGHRVDIFTCAGPKRPPRTLFPNVNLIRLNGEGRTPAARPSWPELLPQAFDSLERYARRSRRPYDLIHSHYWLSGVVGAMAQARWRLPHITMFHTLGAVKNQSRAGENESPLRIAHERWLATTTDRVIVAAPRERENLIRFYHARSEKVRVIPCGVNLDLFQPLDRSAARRRLNLPQTAPVVLYVGRFAPVKGLERLIAAVARLRRQYPEMILLIVGGDGPLSPAMLALQARAERLQIADAVRFAGRIEQPGLPLYYSAADLLALPSLYESFGLVVLEALACGLPVAATPVGAVETIIHEKLNGTIAASAAPGDIAAGIARLLDRSPARERGAVGIRATAQLFGWPRVAAAVWESYEELLQAHDCGQAPALLAQPCGGLWTKRFQGGATQ